MLEKHKQAEIDSRTEEFMAVEATKPFGWGAEHWVRWATIDAILSRLEIGRDASILDLGSGSGWISLLLAESGLEVTAVDIAPANVELTRTRAARWGVAVDARVGDMDSLDLGGRTFDAVLLYDALHHSSRQAQVIANVARHLRPGGWAVFGEPSFLHSISPAARQVSRDRGWKERGVTVRALRRDCRAAGLGRPRRFFAGTEPYQSRTGEFAWQLVRLVAANFAVAPQAQVWAAAQRSRTGE